MVISHNNLCYNNKISFRKALLKYIIRVKRIKRVSPDEVIFVLLLWWSPSGRWNALIGMASVLRRVRQIEWERDGERTIPSPAAL
jgi:hypothetical protein